MRRVIAFAPLAALLAAVGLFAGWSLRHGPQVTPMAMVGKPLPALDLVRLDGAGHMPLRAAAKGPALVNFYASWCAPCAAESPALLALKAEGVRIIGVAYKDDRTASKGFLQRLGDPYAVSLADPDGSAGIEFGLTGVPETYAVDAAGVIRAKRAQPIDAADAEALLAAAD
ncbi:MAG TPA: DsbE family thiol:disulfide interchange protein [Caulobacteraceae bacterium]|jgi:cytochrome c biogenesis protein CcmG/thiol:disulfide interchange protein DsbE|nr:DsbE family thiol:disulfide interchange protein [Caulobacteraceae bacterium]